MAIQHGPDSKGKMVHVGQGEAEGDLHVETRNIDNKQQRGDW